MQKHDGGEGQCEWSDEHGQEELNKACPREK